MPKKYKYVNGNKMIVVNNYDLGTDVIPEEEQIVPDPLVTDVGKVLTVNQAGNPAWEDAPEELPSLTGNGGKVLKVNSGATGVEWDDESTELPSITGNAGKVLTVSSGASGVEWADVPEELPAVTSADEGDVLTVNASGEWEAAAPGGGGGLIVTFTTNDNGLTYTCNKTVNEIASANQSKTPVYGYAVDSGGVSPLIFGGAAIGEFFAYASFTKISVFISDSYMEAKIFSMDASNVVTVTIGDFTLTPQ